MTNFSQRVGFLRLPEVLEIVPVSKPTLYRWIRMGKFPKQVKLGPLASGWRVEDVREYINRIGG